MKILKSFGVFAAVGVLVEFVVAMIVCSFFMTRYERQKGLQNPYQQFVFFDSFLLWLSRFVQRRYKLISLTTFAWIAIAVIGLLQLKVDTYSLDFLLESNHVKQDSRAIEGAYGFYLPLELRIRGKESGVMKEPESLRALERIQKAATSSKVQPSYALPDLVKQLHKVLEGSYQIPNTREAVAQELLLYEMDSDNRWDAFSDTNAEEARLTLKIPMVSSGAMKEIVTKLEEVLSKHLPPQLTYSWGGYVPLYIKMMEYIAEGQVTSFLWASLMIFLILGFVFRSATVFLFGFLVNVLPIALTLGVMGYLGIRLDVATVTIASIALGVVVDDTTHFVFNYRSERKVRSIQDAVHHTILSSGAANLTTSILLVCGFVAMVFASIKSVIYFGLLICFCVVFAILCDLFLLPSLLILFDRKQDEEKLEQPMEVAHVR